MQTKQKQENEDYHLACQNCGTTEKPLHMLPLRNDKHVVGLIICCDDCHNTIANKEYGIINE